MIADWLLNPPVVLMAIVVFAGLISSRGSFTSP